MVLLIIDVSVILFDLTHSLFSLALLWIFYTVVETYKENEKSHI